MFFFVFFFFFLRENDKGDVEVRPESKSYWGLIATK